MRSVTDNKKLDIISTFIRALLDRICDESESCPVTKVFKEYVDVINKVCGHNGGHKCTATDITELRRDIQQFQMNRVAVFSAYKKSEMGTIIWYLKDYEADDIVPNGGLFLCDAGLYYYYDVTFKLSVAKTS